MTRSERATTFEWLEAVMIANELQGDTDGCDERGTIYKAVSSNRYVERSHVEKTGKREAQRVARLNYIRPQRDLRMNKQTFELFIKRLRSHFVYFRSPGKQKQALAQLQLEVFLYSLA
ncbi:hypothetical protein GN244_ATG18895 [Phytophthora infestans]|uniref:DDE Tnp4 domain-containing protein n=1 Tax=Phytophthora infestans TaxID=4787 RepID=A0A833WJJ9_PHYIN|nr:hypothetical protein GN244_ATG18895 [Phytophthora infestans]KAF4132196.1 hypothetical protein GN958_ATG18598 [Phytophthora infestans]